MLQMEMYCHECGNEWIEAEENANCYECPKCHSKSIYRSRFLTCVCGATVYCDDFTNQCDKCGAFYNTFGQRLANPSDWDEEERQAVFCPQNNNY